MSAAAAPTGRVDEHRLDALKQAWLISAVADLTALVEAIERTENGACSPADGLRQIHRLAHDLKGQAGQFGFDLLSKIAASLCLCIYTKECNSAAPSLAVVRAHHVALDYVLSRRKEGDWEDSGAAIMAKLNLLAGRGSTGLPGQA